MREPSTLHIFANSADLNVAGAKMITQLAQAAVAERGCFRVALSGGSTPAGIYQLWGERPYCDETPWQDTHLLWGDERLVPPDDSGSNYRQVADLLLPQVPIPPENIHRIRGEWQMDTAVAHYTHQLQAFATEEHPPVFDLVLLGLGSDGHTASLFPGSPVQQPAWVVGVTADYNGRPANRVSLTPTVLNQARHITFLGTGRRKAKTLQQTIYGPYQPDTLPAQRIRPVNGTLAWFTDQAAAQALYQLT